MSKLFGGGEKGPSAADRAETARIKKEQQDELTRVKAENQTLQDRKKEEEEALRRNSRGGGKLFSKGFTGFESEDSALGGK